MAEKTWKLLDTTEQIFVDHLVLTPSVVGGNADSYRIAKRQLVGGLSNGVDIIEVDNGVMSFTVVPTRGMGIWRAACHGIDLGWNSPVRGPVHPQHVRVAEPSGLGWLDGFDELLVRCGLESNGAPEFEGNGRLKYPLHGRIANRPAHRVTVTVEEDSGEIEIAGSVDEVRFHFAKLCLTTRITTRVGQPWFRVFDEIENLGGTTAEAQLLYHINLGPPILEPGSSVVLPVDTVVPRNSRAAESIADWSLFGPPKPGYAEQVYFFKLLSDSQGKSRAMLKNRAGDKGVCVDFPTTQLPCFTLWKNTVAEADGYVAGLEPGTNYPNTKSFEKQQQRVLSLEPGAKAKFEVGFTCLGSSGDVSQTETDIGEIQIRQAPKTFDSPQPVWCE